MAKFRALPKYLPTAILLMAVTFSFGYYTGHYGLSAEPLLPQGEGRPVDLTNFWATKNFIEEKYPGKVDSQQLITGASKGLVEGLGDPYSAYLTPDLVKQLDQQLSGSVEGIGIELGEKNGQPTVIAPLPNTPAAKAGIVSGDVIVAVDGEPVTAKGIDEVANKIRGPKGSQVSLDLRSDGQPAPRKVVLTRELVKAPSVQLSYRDDVAVIDLSRYGEDTQGELEKVVVDIQQRKPRGIVLDLRSNPGGFLEQAIDVTSVFQRGGTIVKEEFAKGRSETRSAKDDGRLASVPLVILVNKGTASAAEITAGALRDNRGVKLVGEKTFGKGSVQELEDLQDGAVLKLTVAEWFTPKGTAISKQGLSPDVEVSSDNPDAQLDAALKQLP